MVGTQPGLGELILVHRCWLIQDDIPLWSSKLTTEFIKNSLDWCRKDFHFCYYTLFLQSAYGLWTRQWSSTHQSDCWMGTRDKSQVNINNHQYKVNMLNFNSLGWKTSVAMVISGAILFWDWSVSAQEDFAFLICSFSDCYPFNSCYIFCLS